LHPDLLDPQRFLETFRRFSEIGWDGERGMYRLSLSESDLSARRLLIEILRSIGASISYDEAGNIIAETGEREKAIAIGSHLDSVPGGGRYDGALGVIAGLEVLRILSLSRLKMRHRIMLIDFTNEEGSRWTPSLMGSGLSTGVYDASYIYSRRDRDGISFGEALERSGFKGDRKNNLVNRPPKYYLELHIEQGPELDSEGYQIGIPLGIVSIRNWECMFRGESNHAGTTPMEARRDPLIAFSKLAQRVREYALRRKLVRATIGRVDVYPGIHNVIPGEIRFSLEARSPESRYLEDFERFVRKQGDAISDEEGVEFELREAFMLRGVRFDGDMISVVEEVCKSLGLRYKKMWSWAGHDAQHMARISKTGMIFVPSVGGKSHSRDEYTREEDMINGLRVLLETVLRLDKK
jgi:N-carbamoyl-L-amino-acid hydrolase